MSRLSRFVNVLIAANQKVNGVGSMPWHVNEDLVTSGVPAQAEVLEAELTNARLGDPVYKWAWRLRLSVRPQEQAPYEATAVEYFRRLSFPTVGTTVHVLYDEAEKTRLIVDHRSDADRIAGVGSPREDPRPTPDAYAQAIAAARAVPGGTTVRGTKIVALGRWRKGSEVDRRTTGGEHGD